MPLAITKKPISENTHKTKHGMLHVDSWNSFTACSHSQIPIIQCKTICPCDGGCPRCAGVIQSKLTIGQSNDIYEQEADSVAEQVMRMPDTVVSDQPSVVRKEDEAVQRKPTLPFAQGPSCGEEEIIQPKLKITPLVQRQVEEEKEEPVMMKCISSETQVKDDIYTKLNLDKGGGQPLPEADRSFMEKRFGFDFSEVRIHRDSNAAKINRRLNAQAFTHGRDIYFDVGRYNPGVSSDKKLLAHELTHVVQQNRNTHKSTVINNDISTVQVPKIQRRVRFFVCNSADQNNINNAISMSVLPGTLRSAVDTASDTAAAWANNAANLLRVSPRTADIRNAFHDAFAAYPEWVPPWFATLGVRWADFGDLIAERLQRVANILSEGWIQYYCWGSPTKCPECTDTPPTYYACSSYLGRYLICLGQEFWRLWAAGNTGDMATTLIHEALHIYFSTTVAHRGRSGNAACYERFVYEANGHPIHPDTASACPTA
jgi:hypothetical protein